MGIESITWLNGGLFNEAYTPRAMQKLMSANPVGRHPESAAGQSVVAADSGAHHQRDVRARTPSRRAQMLDLFHQILEFNDGKRVLHKVGRFLE